jgi:hypothetical protein
MTKSLLALASILLFVQVAYSQDLAPRAYVITPVHSNAALLSYSFYNGEILFNGILPITDTSATVNVPTFTLYHSFNLAGRSANFTATLPYGVGNFSGKLSDVQHNVYRSGLLDTVLRFSVNLKGGPALSRQEFRSWRQKWLIGASVKVTMPTGQYDSTKLINCGSNRWAFKPELGISRRWGNWIADAYSGVWFFTANPKFFSENEYASGIYRQTQKPIFSFEGHLSYDVKPRMWVSFDGNYWHGGATSLNGIENPATVLSNSRLGGTVSVPVTSHQSFKVSYNYGAYIRYGGNYQNVSVAWQYSWLGRPFKHSPK